MSKRPPSNGRGGERTRHQAPEPHTGFEAFDLARKGDGDALADLFQRGLDPDFTDPKGSSLIMLAAYHGQADTVRFLAQQGADPSLRNARGLSPLDGAAFKGDLAVIQALIAAGAPVNGQGPDGRTPLMWACGFNQVEAMRLLISLGADPDLRDLNGFDARTHAQGLGATAVESELARHHANPQACPGELGARPGHGSC